MGGKKLKKSSSAPYSKVNKKKKDLPLPHWLVIDEKQLNFWKAINNKYEFQNRYYFNLNTKQLTFYSLALPQDLPNYKLLVQLMLLTWVLQDPVVKTDILTIDSLSTLSTKMFIEHFKLMNPTEQDIKDCKEKLWEDATLELLE